MCGIAGIVRWETVPSASDVHAMCDALVHRGPDDEGVYVGQHVAMGMRRLSIIDVAAGHQPIANEDRSVWVVFNGEIYNYKELRDDLRRCGHVFETSTDTETLVHLYEEYGPALTDKLRGMFAFAIWDARQRQLLLGRDRLGIKPLFYAALPDGLAFASELKALLALPYIERELRWSSLAHVLTFLATPATHSIVDGIEKLDAGHWGLLRHGRPLVTERYWDVAFAPDTASTEDELAARVRETLDEAVALHLRSDVPVGAFLSGGVDSSAVVAAMSRQAVTPIKTFSIGFAEPAFDERPHARRVADVCGTEHHELVLMPQDLSLVEEIVWHLDEPFGDSSAIPTYMVSKLAAQHVKVVLSGDGGDELFGGYDKYVVEQHERRYDRWPRLLKRACGAIGRRLPHGTPGQRWLSHVALSGARRYVDASTLFAGRELQRLLTADARRHLRGDEAIAPAVATLNGMPAGSLAAMQYWDLHHYLPLDILVKVDRMTMAHSLEARPVLLDHRLVELAATIPESLQVRGSTRKYLFKRAVAATLPDGVAQRRKQGFDVPLAHWFRGPWLDFVGDTLLSKTSRERGIVNGTYVEHLLRLNRRGRAMDRELWTLVCFEQWCRTFLDAPVRATAPSAMPVLVAASGARG
jgi:asparagine synthase (glutamine-hydrolysing)